VAPSAPSSFVPAEVPAWGGIEPVAATPLEVVAEPTVTGPSLGSKLMMLGFGVLTGFAILMVVLAASGQLGRFL
jgi:hypothetical protein